MPVFIVMNIFMTLIMQRTGKSPFEHPTYGRIFIIGGLVAFVFALANLYLPIWGYFIRFDKAGTLCSGDLYEGSEDNPKPYLWETGSWIYFVVVLFLTLCHAI